MSARVARVAAEEAEEQPHVETPEMEEINPKKQEEAVAAVAVHQETPWDVPGETAVYGAQAAAEEEDREMPVRQVALLATEQTVSFLSNTTRSCRARRVHPLSAR